MQRLDNLLIFKRVIFPNLLIEYSTIFPVNLTMRQLHHVLPRDHPGKTPGLPLNLQANLF